VDEGDTVTLTGAASTDSDGTIASYSWTQIAGPTVALDTPNAVTCDFTAPEVSELTTMTFELTVTDNSGATNTDTVNIYVTDTTPPAVPTVGRSFRQLIA
jgi:chitinase